MDKYIALLRGINVSGQKKIKMEELRFLFESIGFTEVQTYIQSGNVLFNSSENDSIKIQSLIEQSIKKTFGFIVPVMIINNKKIKKVLSDIPTQLSNVDNSQLYFVFLDSIPDKSLVSSVQQFNNDKERFVVVKDIIYFYCSIGIGKTKLNNNFFERKLKVKATSRNWKTTNRLSEMCGDN